MRAIIHDLDEQYNTSLNGKYDTVICANGKYAHCQGCFGCWTKTPATCFMKDTLKEISRIIGNADELVIVTENCYGAYSPAVKNVLDRSIGLSTPLSTYRGKQMHHTLRYGTHKLLSVFAYGDMTENESKTFKFMISRNAINFGFEISDFHQANSIEQLEALL